MRLSRHRLNLTASAMALLAASSSGAALASTLPASGTVAAGNASISTTGTTLTVNQSSANAVINWQSFNVGAGNKVVFVQPNAESATLNRVTGNTTSVIAGDISANGSVYLINPNGIQITSSGVISVGRGFVASTLDLADADFVAGKGKFTGHGGTITQAGTITTQTGGFVGLLAGNVSTSGTILAPAGHVVIGAGTLATLDINGGGFLQVALPSGAALAADGSAALVTGGAARDAVRNIVNLPGTINAQSVSGTSGSIDLGGTISVDATSDNGGHIMVLGQTVAGKASLSARALGQTGDGGLIETSGHSVDFTGFTITTAAVHGRTGTWLLDPLDLTIDAAGATALSTALASNSVILQTTGASDATGTSSATGIATAVNPSAYGTAAAGNGDITIASALSWNSANTLTLQAYNNINISATISAAAGGLVLTAGNGVAQAGSVSATKAVSVGTFSLTNGNWVQNTATLPGFSATDFSFDPNNASFLRVTGGAGTTASPYQITDSYGLQGINSVQNLVANYVLVNDINATGTATWNNNSGFQPIGLDASDIYVTNSAGTTGFAGTLDGQGHTISGLTIKLPNSDNIGMFSYLASGAVIRNLGVTAATVSASSFDGILAGLNFGTISNSYSTGSIVENNLGTTGGLVGQNSGTISGGSYSAAVVRGTDNVGGLVGFNDPAGHITASYATGAVTQIGSVGDGGGLAGQNYGTITDSYATGAVNGTTVVGGLVGLNVGGASILGSYATGKVAGTDPANGIAGGLVGQNAGIIANDGSLASYATGAVTSTITVGGLVGQQDSTGSTTGAYATGSVGAVNALGKFTGSIAGGLIGQSSGSISKSYATGNVQGGNAVGGLVGTNYGSITDTYATGSATSGAVAKIANVGGLVGQNSAPNATGASPTITQSYATGAVASTVSGATGIGGLVGGNYGTVTASFYNTQTTGQSDTNKGTGVTTAQLQNLATFTAAGWAIDNAGGTANAWRIYEGSTAPLLRNFLTPLTISGNTATVTYDGNAHSVSGYTVPGSANLTKILGTTSATTATGTNAGTYTASLAGLYSNQQGYDLTLAPVTLTITGAQLTAITAGLTGSITKIYDGTTVASLTAGNFVLSGFVSGQGASVNQTVGTYASANVGSGISVTANLTAANFVANSGTNLANYLLPTTATGTIGAITPASLSVIATAQSRTYGATNPALTFTQTGLVTGDTLSGSLATAATAASNVGTYAISQGTLSAGSNYTLSYTGANLAVTPASLTVTYGATAANSTYGTTPSGLTGTVTASGLVNGDLLGGVTTGTAAWATTVTALSNVGNYTITGSGLSANTSNYNVTFAQAAGNATALTVTPASLSVIATAQSRTYGATNPALTYTETGLVNGDTLSGSLFTTATSASNVGTYAIAQGTLNAGSNYTLSYTGANLAVTPASLTVTYTANAASSTFGTTPSGLTGTVAASGLVNGDLLGGVTTGSAAWTTTATATSHVGSYAITGSGLTAASANYNVTFAQAASNATALTITQKALTAVTAGLTGSITKVYDGTLSATLTSANYVLSGFVNGNGATVNQTVGTYASANVGSGIGVTANLTAANFVANAGTDLGNYSLPTSATGNIGAITPASVTVTYTAAPVSSTYGTTPGGLTGSLSATGIVDGKSIAAITTGSLLWGTTATAASNVGRYAVTGSGLSGNDGNYTVSFAQAAGNATALVVNPATLTVTYTADAATSIYGTTPAGLTGSVSETGLVNGDLLANVTGGTASWSATNANSTSHVGHYNVSGNGISTTSANYIINAVQAAGNATALTINPASLTVIADAQTRTYGKVNPALTYSTSGLVNGDTLTGGLTTAATQASHVGTYGITQGSLAASSDYTLHYTGANLSITPAVLTVTYSANTATSTYGTTPTGLTGTVAEGGLVNGDLVANVVGGTASWTTTASSTSNVGHYGVTGSGIVSTSADYTINTAQAPGNATALTVNPAALTVTYNADAANFVYGTTPSGLTGTVAATGLVNGDTLAGVTGGTAGWSTTATSASNVGNYAITGSGLTAANSNYNFTFAQAAGNATALTISKAPLIVVTAGLTGSITKVYDGTLSATLTSANYVLSGFVNGNGATVNQTVGTYASGNVGSGIGVTANLSAANFVANAGTDLGNYSLPTSATGNIGAITPASVTVTYNAASASSIYGTAPGGLTGSLSATGIVDGKAISAITTGSLLWGTTATSASNVGSYAVTGSGLSGNDGNYTVSFAQAAGNATALTINPASLTVTYNAQTASSIYGTTPAGLSGTVAQTGLVNGDTLAEVLSGTAQWTTAATATSNVGTYAITGSGLSNDSANYTVHFAQGPGNGTALTINPASLSVIADAQTRSYGAANPVLTYSTSGLVNGDTLTGSLATIATAASHVGTYGIALGTLSAGSNYTLGYTGANLSVTPASLTVLYTASLATSTYGSVPAGLTGSVTETGLLNGDTLANVISGTANWATTATATSTVGRYDVTGSGINSASADYTINAVQATGNTAALTVNPATLTVTYTADAATSIYGTTPGGLTGVVVETGLVNGDALANVISGTAAWTTAATAISHVGHYGVTGSGIASTNANYTINAVQAAGNAGALTINPASLSVIANAQTRTYGAANPVLTYSTLGLVNGDTLSGSLATTATAASHVGTYGITLGTLSAGNDYTIGYTGANLAVTPASLTVTYNASAATSTYGTTPTGLTGAVNATGLLNGDTLAALTSGTATWTTTASATSNVGAYAITGSGLSAVAGGDYTIAFAQGAGNASALTVNPASLTVTYNAQTATSTYGMAPGGLTGTVAQTGLVNGDTLATVLSGTAQWTTTAGTRSNVGTYAIAGSGLSGSSANYTVHFAQGLGNAGALTINPATLAVIANAQTRTYGAANPTLTYTTTGLVNGDTLSGSLATTATAASNVGSYGITLGSLSAGSNYTLGYTGANLAVTPASLTLTYVATPATFVAGSPLVGLTGNISASGLVNGDTVSGVTGGTAMWTTTANNANPGSYPINGSGLSANSGNYTFTFNQAPGNATALSVVPVSSQFGSNTLVDQSPPDKTPAGSGDSQALNGNNDVSQLDLNTDASKNCPPKTSCPAGK